MGFRSLVWFSWLGATFVGCDDASQSAKLPNVLWLSCEDISPLLGCYGDSLAHTPNLDRFAKEAILFENAFSNAPVSGPSRSTIITGCYANSIGTDPMASIYAIPDSIELYPTYLQQLGYYCTNNQKTHYQLSYIGNETDVETSVWDESSFDAHYKNRAGDEPFFAIFNSTIPHESTIHIPHSPYNMLHRADQMQLAPYHPDTPEIRHDYAQFYDSISLLDTWFGYMLDELDKSGLSDNTIVFFYSDHGGILGRSKRFSYDSGLRIPLMVRIPPQYRHLSPLEPGSVSKQLVTLVDLAPTLLNIVGTEIPKYMQGQPFLGEDIPEPQRYAYAFDSRMDSRIDMRRSVRDEEFRYIRNYMPYKIHGQHINFLWLAQSMRSWEQMWLEGRCNEEQSYFWQPKEVEELYLITNDPYEVKNLANDPKYSDDLRRLRGACDSWMVDIKDSGLIPESMREEFCSTTQTLVHYTQSDDYDVEEILTAANNSIYHNDDIDGVRSMLLSDDAIVRYWGLNAVMCNESLIPRVVAQLEKILSDRVAINRAMAAKALMRYKPSAQIANVITSELDSDSEILRTHIFNLIVELGVEYRGYFIDRVSKFYAENQPVGWSVDRKIAEYINNTLYK